MVVFNLLCKTILHFKTRGTRGRKISRVSSSSGDVCWLEHSIPRGKVLLRVNTVQERDNANDIKYARIRTVKEILAAGFSVFRFFVRLNCVGDLCSRSNTTCGCTCIWSKFSRPTWVKYEFPMLNSLR